MINVQMMDLPGKTKALTIPNADGTYTIIINSRLSFEQQQKSFLHELNHIYQNDFGVNEIDLIEQIAHNRI